LLEAQNPDSNHPPSTDAGGVPAFKYPFSLSHKRLHEGGWSREVTVRELAVSKTMAGVDMRLTAGGVRELHWHTAAERARTTDFESGDVGYIQQTLPHYIENTGDADPTFLEMFKSSFYQDLSLSEWLTHTPTELVMAHLNIDKATLDAIPRNEAVIMPE
jgi:oxalate decarboxylase